MKITFFFSVFLIFFVCCNSIFSEELTYQEPTASFIATDSEEKKEITVIEERESEKEKEINTLKFGLEDEISNMLDGFIKEKTYLYLDEIYDLFNRTKTTALKEKIITYFTEAKSDKLSEYTVYTLEDPFDEKVSTVSLLFKYAATMKIKDVAVFARNLLENDHLEYLDSVLTALAEIGNSEDAVFLAEFLKRDDLSVAQQQSVMKALGKLKSLETWDYLVEICQDEEKNSFVRMYAAEAIGAMKKTESIPILIDLYDGTDPNFRASVVKALGNFIDNEDAESIVIEAIRDSHPKVRLEAINSIKENKVLKSEPYILYRAKNDPEISIKHACYETLGQFNTKNSLDFLISVIKDKKAGDSYKSKVAEVIVATGSKEGIDAVLELTKSTLKDDKKKTLRYSLGKILAKEQSNLFAEICKEFLQSKDVSTVGIGLDIFSKNLYPEVEEIVNNIANAEKADVNRTKARKILDRK